MPFFLKTISMKLIFSAILLTINSFIIYSQEFTLSGKITDNETGVPIIGATVKTGSQGAITDIDGNYAITLTNGKYTINTSYLGYDAIESEIILTENTVKNFILYPQIMKEVLVSADIAIDRKTPVAFSNIPTLKIKEELASQDIPMLLNSTPGAYATQSGGGDGDARVTIRGFNQRNVAVMLDGIPVNDMENGQVYWSNWFGLSNVTKTMQVQRGLGSSKLAVPSIGGTINIITKGIESKANFSYKTEYGNNDYSQTTIGFNSGRLKGGWGISLATAYKTNEGWVDGTYSKALFYYLRIDKEFGKHLLTLSGFGGPQDHGQRAFTDVAWRWDSNFARDLGIPNEVITNKSNIDRGLQYNSSWGYRDSAKTNILNTRTNYYHKPQFSLRHSWNISSKSFLSNVAYLSIGNGGGTAPEGAFLTDSTGQLNVLKVINTNPFLKNPTILRSNVNNHIWYGLLSTFKQEINQNLSTSFGIDLRSYEGEHYRKVFDLLGSEKGYLGKRNARIPWQDTRLKEGDRYYFNNKGFVKWAGAFGLLEYKKDNLSAFLNVSGSYSAYKYEDYMFSKYVEIDGKKYYSGYWELPTSIQKITFDNRIAVVNGTAYTVDHPGAATLAEIQKRGLNVDSTSAKDQSIGWLYIPSFTFKTGANYQINRNNSIFVNLGYLSKATRYNNAIYSSYSSTKELGIIKEIGNRSNEIITAFELGYTFRSKKFSANVNSYYTNWKNKPFDGLPTILEDPTDPNSDRIPVNVNGLGARHIGLEFDCAYEFSRKLKVEGLLSIADWIWNSKAELINPIDGTITIFDPLGVHVGDAAQHQLGAMIRYEPIKKLYISTRATYFGKNYSNLDPTSLVGINAQRESWKMPNYFTVDANSGFQVRDNGITLDFRLSILNLLNTTYLSDAINNGFNSDTKDFDAKSSNVFFGQGRRWVASLEISF
jgi:iron complex outermembrane recepter protein